MAQAAGLRPKLTGPLGGRASSNPAAATKPVAGALAAAALVAAPAANTGDATVGPPAGTGTLPGATGLVP